MQLIAFLSIFLVLFVVSAKSSVFYYQPEQVHLSFGQNVSEIVVTWSTFSDTKESVVEYGKNQGLFNRQAKGSRRLFVDGGSEKRAQWIHRVVLKGLPPNTMIVYHCGSELGWSNEFWFKTVPYNDPNWQPSIALYGDMGNENAQSLARLQKEAQQGIYDVILHVGDFAYDMDTENAKIGDQFMRQIESVAAYVPYMTCPGNHEEKYNFSNYRERFSMPNGLDSPFYSINIGPMHLVSISTEVYYFLNYGLKPMVFQYQWLEEDLSKANVDRIEQPWIMVMGHRPMYCSNENTDDCTHNETLTRVGLPFFKAFGLEKLFYDYGVDLEIWAHEHSYERLWPIYDYKVYNGSISAPYTDPKAPVQIVTGSAGCKEGRDPFTKKRPFWSAKSVNEYGYTKMRIFNHTHVYMEQISDDRNGAIVDSFWVIKNTHGPYDKSDMNWEKIEHYRLLKLSTF